MLHLLASFSSSENSHLQKVNDLGNSWDLTEFLINNAPSVAEKGGNLFSPEVRALLRSTAPRLLFNQFKKDANLEKWLREGIPGVVNLLTYLKSAPVKDSVINTWTVANLPVPKWAESMFGSSATFFNETITLVQTSISPTLHIRNILQYAEKHIHVYFELSDYVLGSKLQQDHIIALFSTSMTSPVDRPQ